MKKVLLITLILMFNCCTIVAQEVYIDIGKNISNFKFTNSSGQDIDYLRATNNTLGFGFRAPFDFTADRLYLGGGFHLNRYGASGTEVGLNNTYEWDVNYLAMVLTSDFDLIKYKGFQIYLKGQVSGEIFLQGTQQINGQNFNLKGEEQFDGTKIFMRAGFGANYAIKNDIAAFAYYLVGRNFFNVGEDKSDGEELDISIHSVSIGVLFRLQNYPRFR